MAKPIKTRKLMRIVEVLDDVSVVVSLPMERVVKANDKSHATSKMNSIKDRFSGKSWKAVWIDGETEEIIGES